MGSKQLNFRVSFILVALTLLVLFCLRTEALYFYLEGSEQKCFLEELPKETVVVGTFKAEEWSDKQKQFHENRGLGIQITVEELPHNSRLVNQKGPSSGTFTFTAVESGDHAICFRTNSSSWFSSTQVRLHLDMAIGDTGSDDDPGADHINDLSQRVRDLNHRIADIRREQNYQREREAEFRDQSELTNSRVVAWTIVQLIVLGITCLWQMRHLKSFFEAKKLV
uniref:Transmembrane emp24 domain-containing protein 9 n=1 Tax=Anthurium amnicola TaxID=1678845 RepID=A0A1D1XZ61_9ARAE